MSQGMSMSRTDLPDGSSVLTMPYDEGMIEKSVTDNIERRTGGTPDPMGGSDGAKRGVDEAGPIRRFNEVFTDLGGVYLESMGLDGFEVGKAIQTRRDELFRNRFPVILPRFAHKCTECGAEYDDRADECDNCGSAEMREPDRSERLDAFRLFERVNKEGQSLTDLLRMSEDDHGRLGVGAFVIKYDYVVATGGRTALGQRIMERGEVIRKEPDELVKADPKRLVPVTDEDGRLGGWRWACPVHRDDDGGWVGHDEHEEGAVECDICGTDLEEVCFAEREHVRAKGADKMYLQDEVVSWAHFFPRCHGLDGLSPVHHVWMKQAILHWMDVYAGAFYDPESDSYPNKFMVVHTTSAEQWERNFEQSQDEAEENLYAQKILVNEYASESQSTPEMQVMDLMDDELLGQDEAIKKQYKSDIRTQFGVTDVFDSELEDAGGLNNEGLQLEVTDRSIASAQQKMMDGPLDELMRCLNFDDWRLAFVPENRQDLDELEQRISVGGDADDAGLDARLVDGELEVDDGDIEAGEDEEGGLGGLFADPDEGVGDIEDGLHEAADHLREGTEHIVWADAESKAEPYWEDRDVPERVREAVKGAIDDGALFDDIEDVPEAWYDDLKEFFKEKLTDPDGWSIGELRDGLVERFDLGEGRAGTVARTESASVLGRAREDVFEDLGEHTEDELLYRWIGPDDHRTTDACEWLKERTEDGVTMERLIELEQEAQEEFFPQLDEFRRHVVHPEERHTFTQTFKSDVAGAAGPVEVEIEAVPGTFEVAG